MSHAMRARASDAAPAPHAKAAAKGSSHDPRTGRADHDFAPESERAADATGESGANVPEWSLSRMSVAPPRQREEDGRRETQTTDPDRRGALADGDVGRSPGHPLDSATRGFFESRFAHDFSRVRVHFDSVAAQAARSTDARAFTVGNRIVFGAGKFTPHSDEGRKLLAHELTHVVQQSRGGQTPEVNPRAAHEKDAALAANAIAAGATTVRVASATGIGLARAESDDPGLSDDDDPQLPEHLVPKPSDSERTRAAKIEAAEHGINITQEFAERAHDEQPVELAHERLGSRKRSSEEARHRTRDEETQEHHGFPKFLGGNKVQTYIKLPREIHETYHADLNRVLKEEFAKFHPGEDISPRYFSVIFSRLSKKQKAQVLKRVMQHAAEFDSAFKSQYKDQRTRLTAALRRGIKEARIAEKTAKKKPAPPSTAPAPLLTHPAPLPAHPANAPKSPKPPTPQAAIAHTAAPPIASAAEPATTTVKKPTDPAAVEHGEHPEGKSEVAKPRASEATGHASTPQHKGTAPAPTGAAADVPPIGVEHKKPEPRKAMHPPVPVLTAPKEHPATAAGPRTTPPVSQVKPPAVAKPPSSTSAATPPPKAPSEPRPSAAPPRVQLGPGAKPAVPVGAPSSAPHLLPTAGAKSGTALPIAEVKAPAPARASSPSSPTGAAPKLPVAATPPDVAPKVQAGPGAKTIGPASQPPAARPSATKPAVIPVTPSPKTPHHEAKATKPSTTAAPQHPAAPSHDEPDAHAEEHKSRSHYVQPRGSVIAGPGKLGAAGSLSAGATQSHAHGVETSQSVDFGGKVVTNVEEVPDKSPPQYRVTLTIDLSAGVGAGASREGGLGGSVSGSASGSLTMSVSHVMSGDAKDQYLKTVKSGGGGASEELRVAQLVARGSIDEAKTYLQGRKQIQGSAQAAKHMAEGDEVTLSAGGKVEGSAGLSGRSGGTGVGATFGMSRSGEITRTQARQGGKVVITVAATAAKGTTVGASFGEGPAGMGLSHEGAQSKGKSVTFALDPDSPGFDAAYNEIMAANTVDDLDKLAARRADLLGSTTTSRGTSATTTTSASLGFVGATGREGGSYNEEETRDASGISHKYEGSGTSGVSLSVAGKDVASTTTTDQFTGTVGPDNTATGETSSTTSETDYLGSIRKLAASYDKRPVGTTAGVATGGTKVLQEHSEVAGKKLTNDSYARLAELAKDPAGWQKSWHGNVSTLMDWEATRQKVLAADGDRNLIAKAMAEFESQGSGRSRTVENAISDTGLAFDFPDELMDQKPVFDELVSADPLAHPRDLAGAGRPEDAVAELNADNVKLGKLLSALQMHQQSITNPAALGEMQRRISEKRTAIRAEIRKLTPHAPQPTAPAGDAKGGAKPDKEAALDAAAQAEQQEAAQKREERNAKVEDLIPTLLTNREKERANFGAVYEEFKKEDSWFSKPDPIVIAEKLNQLKPLYEQWNRSIAELRAVYTERGESGDRANQYAPNQAEWNALYARAFH